MLASLFEAYFHKTVLF